MLLLTRNSDESIIIDGGIKITVLETSGSHVKIGIDAPAEVKVYREEIVERMKAEADSKDAAWIRQKEARLLAPLLRIAGAFLFLLLQYSPMWKVKLDNDNWLAKGEYGPETTSKESEAWLLPNITAVQEQLKKARSLNPYPNAMVIADFNSI